MSVGQWNGQGTSASLRDGVSVAVGFAQWRAAFVICFVLLTVVKLILAATLSPFGDEAFYWQESRHLAWGYSDLPPLTAWLIRLGESLAGHSVLGMRWPFLLMGSALPWLVRALAREWFDERAGWQAGLLCMALPLAGSLGVLALPDAPLTVAITWALYALVQAMEGNRWRHWLLLGVALDVCWLTHYRAAIPMLAGLLLLVFTARGRGQWRRGGFWLAIVVAALGLIPLVISNWQQRGAGVAFQLMERNPWQFHADALVQPLEQAMACTPLLYLLLLWAVWRCWQRSRREGAPWDALAVVSLSFIVLYFVLGLFADDLRFRAHWPLPGYLPLLAALPVLLRRPSAWRPWLLRLTFALAALGQVAGLAYLGLAASPAGAQVLAGVKAFPARFVGWRESGAVADRLLDSEPRVLVADNFMLAAEIDFQLNGRVPVYALDNPLNVKHGRAPQLAVWQRDESALHAGHAGDAMVLAVDETALRARERPGWLRTLCGRIAQPRLLERLDLFEGRRRIAFYAGRVPSMPTSAPPVDDGCLIWLQSQQATPVSD